MPVYWDATRAIRQSMTGGGIYPSPSWYISLSYWDKDPYTLPRSEWEIPTSSHPLTTGWIESPAFSSSYYQAGVVNDTTVDIPVSVDATAGFWVIREGYANTKFMWMAKLSNYPLTVIAGDIVRFLPGTLRIVWNN